MVINLLSDQSKEQEEEEEGQIWVKIKTRDNSSIVEKKGEKSRGVQSSFASFCPSRVLCHCSELETVSIWPVVVEYVCEQR